jgi:NAD(P)-dependent dehydrogenase (short-subunit alcohol dehydrogenase family)
VGRLDGKVALVTGAASGIGLGIARRFAAEGARLVLGDVDEDGLAAAAASTSAELDLGSDIATASTDVTHEDEIAALVALATEHFGRLDVVVANAGAGMFAPLVDHPVEGWRRTIDLNLTGTFLTIKHAGRAMQDSGGGSIVAIASLNATQPSAGMAAYCSAKAAVSMLVQVAAMELGPSGIRVNAIAPGLIRTPATAPFFEVPAILDDFVDNTTVGRSATPEDVAAVAVFLASDEAAFVSGSTYQVDGGAHTKRYPDLPAHLAALTQAMEAPPG